MALFPIRHQDVVCAGPCIGSARRDEAQDVPLALAVLGVGPTVQENNTGLHLCLAAAAASKISPRMMFGQKRL